MPDTAAFLASLRDPAGGVRFWRGGEATLLSTAFAAQTYVALDALDEGTARGLREVMMRGRLASGEFSDPRFDPTETKGSHDVDYIRWQTTFFALAALDALGSAPLPAPAFVEPLLEAPARERWLDRRDFRNFWLASNEIMFLLFFLTYAAERHGSEDARGAVTHLLDLMDRRQDPETGYWGDPGSSLENRMYGAAHVYMFYDYLDRPIRFAERIVDATLSLQRPSGLYGKDDGGACEDYDAVEILTKVCRRTSHRRDDVRRSLRRTAEAIRARRDPATGGYSYRLAKGPLSRAVRRWRGKTYAFSGWNRMSCNVYEPDTWATFFRALSLLAVAREAGEPYAGRSTALPGWGYLAAEARLRART